MTEKLFYKDSYLTEFLASVNSCAEAEDGKFVVTLDKTAFFPCEGGQYSDIGTIGDATVVDVINNDDILHIVDKELCVGAQYECKVDVKNRIRNLQNHSGEHIISGLIFSKYGYDNVGFHLGHEEITVDFSGYLDAESLREIEEEANKAVIKNIKIRAEVLDEQEALERTYRYKKDIKKDLRIITIDGYDVCACCVPHVNYTGEIGVIKILDSIRYKGGVRIWMACGFEALKDYNEKSDQVKEISKLLSAKPDEVHLHVVRLLDVITEKNIAISSLKEEILNLKMENIKPCESNRLIFEKDSDMNFMRKYVNACVELTRGLCAIFGGNDTDGYKYIISSKTIDLKKIAPIINAALLGNGGGSASMIQGSVKAMREDIEKFFDNLIL